MKNMKKLLVLTLVGVFSAGTVLSASAAEFNAAWYAAQNPDVVAVYGNSAEALKAHYDRHGKNEYRMSSENDVEAQLHKLFNVEEYKALYPDVAKVFGNNTDAIFRHYIAYGILEGRRPSEKVSQEAALELRKVVIKALTDAGVSAKPGSVELVSIIQGSIGSTKNATLKAALTEVQKVVKEAVSTTIVADVENPASSGGSDSSSDDDSDDSSVSSKPSNPGTGDQNQGTGDDNQGGTTTPTTPDSPGNGGTTTPTTPDSPGNGGTTTPDSPGNGGTTTPTTPDSPGNGGTTTPTTPDSPGNGGTTTPDSPGNSN